MSDEFPHGERRGYRRGCRCDSCLEAYRVYSREYRAARSPNRFKPPKPWPCSIEGCAKPRYRTYRLCGMHRYRLKNNGTTDAVVNCHGSRQERFQRFVVRGPECWGWAGTTNNHGYGRMEHAYAHRIAYELMFGPIPAGLHVLHRCDNPPCTNPSHLMLGTHRDNMRDLQLKKRATSGKPYPVRTSKPPGRLPITATQVAEMQQLKAAGGTARVIADLYGISANYLSSLVSGRRQVRA